MTDTRDIHSAVMRMVGAAGTSTIEELRYGENPHQKGWFIKGVREVAQPRRGVGTATLVQGKPLSFNNIQDADAAYECVAEFDPEYNAACAIIKHANPCGVAESELLLNAYRMAYECDQTSAFGGVVAFNREIDAETAQAVTQIFTEVIIAPNATEEAKSIIAKKKDLRLLLAGSLPDPRAPGLVIKSVAGGLLVQTRDNCIVGEPIYSVVTKRKPTEREINDMLFAIRVAKHVKSNAIVYAKNLATVGIGAGQMSRVDSSRIATRKAEDMAKELDFSTPLTQGSVAASDAFFPFADGLLTCIEAGATAVIQPGGSKRDEEVIKAADDHEVAMVFTGVRHFRH